MMLRSDEITGINSLAPHLRNVSLRLRASLGTKRQMSFAEQGSGKAALKCTPVGNE
jgi:hypothetical protein